MPAQHQDILVFNSFTGTWQNASGAGPSGAPLGAVIGAPGGSSVGMIPAIGSTLLVDGVATATINSALQMETGAASELTPASSASVVFNEGAANEQLGQLTVSGLNGNSAQAVLMTSQSADATINGSIKHGGITPGITTTYAFTTMHSMYPASQLLQLGSGFQLVTTTPGGTVSESWHNLSLGAGWTGTFQYTLVPLGHGGAVMIDVNIVPGTVTDATSLGTIPAAYRPIAVKRVACDTDGGPKSTGGNVPSIRIQAGGDVAVFGVSTAASFLVGCGIYPLGT